MGRTGAILVVADDLIWASRLEGLVRDAGGRPILVHSLRALDGILMSGFGLPAGAVVDLAARDDAALPALQRLADAGVPAVAVGQHDDREGRAAARAAGAAVVYAYGALAGSGARGFESWVREVGVTETVDAAASAEDTSGELSSVPAGGPEPAGGPAAALVPPGIPAARYASRLAAARSALVENGALALLVGVGADLRWLTGYQAMNLERLTMLVLPRDGDPALIAPRLEAPRAALAPAVAAGLVRIVTWEETEDAVAVVPGLVAASGPGPRAHEADPGRLLVSDRLWASFVLRLQAAFAGASFGLASEILRPLRMTKDPDEIVLLRMAAHAADRVVLAIAAGRLVGRTEMDVAREVRERLIDEGHEDAGFAIVGSGPNSASPHHEASGRVIRPGEPIVLDIGGSCGGYGSDTTRTLWVTGDVGIGPGPEFLRLYDVLQRAQALATDAVAPGVPAERIDAIGRNAIAEAGFGPAFTHRIGHGIGLEEHEDPYLVAGNGEPLQSGYAFSVEPGIYLEGRYGARIEDIVVCGAAGPDVLNETARDLLVVRGT
ncbi:MAG: Xaa-Pro peptidase family protein [Chloroflexi bacterium]|nr:Xaa-Pro peptidase family protein [Chloroflexota bacterium]